MDIERLLFGAFCCAVGLLGLLLRHQFADTAYHHYNSILTGTTGPKWQFHPTRRQSYYPVYFYAFAFLAAGLYTLLIDY